MFSSKIKLLLITLLIVVFCVGNAKPLEPTVVKKNVKIERRCIRVGVLGFGMLPPPHNKQYSTDKMIAYLKSQMDVVASDNPDLIVLPEHSDDYAWLPPAEKFKWLNMRGETVYEFMREYARKHRCYIAFATYRHRSDVGQNRWSNSTILIDRDGDCVGVYDKNYLTPNESKIGIVHGKDAVVVDTDFGRVGMLICFDMNFWELMDRYADLKPDILAFSSFYHGSYMQNVWAHRCRSYLLGATVGNTIAKTVVGPGGENLVRENSRLNWISLDINTNFAVLHWDDNREKVAAAKRKYGRLFDVHTPNECCMLPVFFNDPKIPIAKILKEFDIETWNEYYDRSVRIRYENMPK